MTKLNSIFNKTALVFLLFLFCFNAVAQVKHPVKKKTSKVSLTKIASSKSKKKLIKKPVLCALLVPKIPDNNVVNAKDLDVMPEFPGGMPAFYRYIGHNYLAPEDFEGQGKVYVSYIVEIDGSLSDIHCLKDVGFGSGAEAIRVMKKCPKWNPGMINGKPVRVKYVLPISIQSASE
jgi:periplasmic protein TonB